MANRYWVGVSGGSWTATDTTNWSDTSGGTGGFSVPTSVDDVFLDANSGTGTVTIATGNMGVKSINCTGYTGTLAGSTDFTVSGNITWGAGMTLTYSGNLAINGSSTYTSNGKSRGGITTINGVGITVTLGDASSFGTLSIIRGTLNTVGYTLTVSVFSSYTQNNRFVNLSSSSVIVTGTGFVVDRGIDSFYFTAGTSTITLTSSSAKAIGTTVGGTLTFYNVVSTGAGNLTLNGACTYNSLTVENTTATSVVELIADNNNTVGTLNLNGSAPTQRVAFESNQFDIQRTVTLTSFGTSANCDFCDIVISGPAVGTSIPTAGNRGNNSGIIFPAPKTVYWNLSGTQGFAANGWATSSGGTPDANNFPLAQDTAIVDNNSAGTGLTVYTTTFAIGTLDMSSRTSAFNVNFSSGPLQLTGSLKSGSGCTFTNSISNGPVFIGAGAATLQGGGAQLNATVTIGCHAGGSVTLTTALSTNYSSAFLLVTSGTFDSAGYAITTAGLRANSGTLPRTIKLGTSSVTILSTSTTGFNLSNSALSFYGENSTINMTGAGGGTTWNGGGQTYGTVNIQSISNSGSFTIVGSNKFNALVNNRSIAYSLLFTGGTTQTFNTFNVSGSSGKVVTVASTNTTPVTLRKYGPWTVGANSTNLGTNTGNLIFTGSSPDYLSIGYINAVDLMPNLLLSF